MSEPFSGFSVAQGLPRRRASRCGIGPQIEIPQQVRAEAKDARWRAQAIGRVEGMTKWLVDPDSRRVLGCGIVGPGAGELIAEAVLAIEMGCEVQDITDSIHPHPTLSETLMNAGEVFFGTATEIYKPKRQAPSGGAKKS